MTRHPYLQLDVFAQHALEVEVDGDSEVWIGGHLQAVIRGSVDW